MHFFDSLMFGNSDSRAPGPQARRPTKDSPKREARHRGDESGEQDADFAGGGFGANNRRLSEDREGCIVLVNLKGLPQWTKSHDAVIVIAASVDRDSLDLLTPGPKLGH